LNRKSWVLPDNGNYTRVSKKKLIRLLEDCLRHEKSSLLSLGVPLSGLLMKGRFASPFVTFMACNVFQIFWFGVIFVYYRFMKANFADKTLELDEVEVGLLMNEADKPEVPSIHK
jgi:hypothetical protein